VQRGCGIAEAVDSIGDDTQVAFLHDDPFDMVGSHEYEVVVRGDAGGEERRCPDVFAVNNVLIE
jgi:hypothetical protein